MRHFARAERVLALVLACVVGSVGIPTFASPSPALISGRIMRAGSGDPVPGAVVRLAHRPDSRTFMSSRTDNSGRYSIAGLPAGTYDLGVEADGGVYVVGGPFSLSSGEQRTMGLSVRSASAAADGENMDEPAPAPPPTPPAPAEPPTPAPEQPTEPPKEPPKEAPKAEKPMPKKVKFWRAPWGGAAIVVGTAVIVGALASSNDEDKSANASPH